MLHHRGAGRELLVAGTGGQQQEVYVGGVDAGHGHGVASGFHRHLGDLSVHVAGPDPAAFADPLVGGIHYLGEVVVGELPFGEVGRPTGDAAVGHGELRGSWTGRWTRGPEGRLATAHQ